VDFNKGKSGKSIFKKVIYYTIILLIASLSIYMVFVKEEVPCKVSASKVRIIKGNIKSEIFGQGKNEINAVEAKKDKPLERVKSFLQGYGLNLKNIISVENVTIPESFYNKPDEAPVGLYWACCNEYSKAIGLDFSPYMGKEVKAYTFSTKQNRDVIILLHDQDIIGGWVAFNSISGMSLNNKVSLLSLSSRWGNWIKENNIVDYGSEEEKEYKKLSSEEIINKYFAFLNNNDYKGACTLYSKLYQSDYLFSNNIVSKIYNSYRELNLNEFYDAENIKILNIKLIGVRNDFYSVNYLKLNRTVAECRRFAITLGYKFSGEDKKEKYVICLVKEAIDAPWKIDYIYENSYDDY